MKEDLEKDDFEVMYRIEKEFYGEEFITPSDEAYQWYKKNPDSTKVLYHRGELIGFCNVFPVHQQVFESICNGKFNDHEMTADDMLSKEEYYEGMNIFFSCIVVREKYRSKEVIEMLLKESLKPYTPDMPKCIQLGEVVMDTVTLEGERFARNCGLTRYRSSDHHSIIWRGELKDLVSKYISK